MLENKYVQAKFNLSSSPSLSHYVKELISLKSVSNFSVQPVCFPAPSSGLLSRAGESCSTFILHLDLKCSKNMGLKQLQHCLGREYTTLQGWFGVCWLQTGPCGQDILLPVPLALHIPVNPLLWEQEGIVLRPSYGSPSTAALFGEEITLPQPRFSQLPWESTAPL